MRNLLNAQSFHYDIVGNLPLEILPLVLRHLEIWQVFQCQRVSKRWATVLSHENTIRPFLHPWLSKSDLDLHTSKLIPAHMVMPLLAQRIDAFRTGRASNRLTCGYNILITREECSFADRVAYCNGVIAWINPCDTSVNILWFGSGRTDVHVPGDRARLRTIALSETMVAVSTYLGKCYIYRLDTRDEHIIRLTSANVHSISISNHTVAILQNDNNSCNSKCLTIWDYETRKSNLFSIDDGLEGYKVYRNSMKLTIDSAKKHVIIFSKLKGSNHTSSIFFTRFTMSGAIVSAGYLESIPYDWYGTYPNASPSDSLDSYTLWSYPECKDPISLESLLVQVVYNFRLDRLELYKTSMHDAKFSNSRCPTIFHWKDTAYYFEDAEAYYLGRSEGPLKVANTNLAANTVAECRLMRGGTLSPPSYSTSGGEKSKKTGVCLFGDGKYLVKATVHDFTVWCFDKTVTMTGQDSASRDSVKGQIHIVDV